ncbi:hypothetical protein [uncultured Thiodictyon sp.]|uniref:hypothetical protein n=1 Tax=uncultured Thiodictyon sp. TaxID=1846217 RepID=UPI0025EE89B9|nr:hypothetical protein [uncultured Thiodictyon sp.]
MDTQQQNPLDAKEEIKLLWELIQQHWTQGRHIDTQRVNMSRIMIAAAAGVIAVVGFNGLSSDDLPLTVFLSFLGIFGVWFSAKYDELFYTHMQLARAYRVELDKLVPCIAFEKGVEQKNALFGTTKKLTNKIRLKHFWMALHSMVALFGILLSIIVATGISKRFL